MSRGLSQNELALKINKTRPLVSHIEQTGKANHYTLLAISKALGIQLEEIENIVNEPKKGNAKAQKSNQENEIQRLKDEIDLLKSLAESQEDVIKLLKEKLKKKK